MKNIQKKILLIILAFYNFGLFANNETKTVDDLINEKEKFENVVFDYSFDYVAKRNTKSKYFYDLNYLFNVPIKVNEIVHVKNRNYLGIANILDFRSHAFEAYKDEQKLIWDIKDFALAGKDWLPNNITNNKWCMKYHFDVLKSEERETLREYENWINYYDDEKLQDYILSKQKSSVLGTWSEICVEAGNPEILITDCCVIIRGFFHYYCSYGFVTDKVENKLKVKWIRGDFEGCFIDKFETIKDGQESIIEFYLDGDYLTIYIDGNKIELAKKCDEFDRQWNSLIKNNHCDLSKVIWPHHVDGTSEYEDTIRYPEPIVIEEAEEIEIEEYDNTDKETAKDNSEQNEKENNEDLEYDLIIPLKKAFPWFIFFSIIAGIVIVALCIIFAAKKRGRKK